MTDSPVSRKGSTSEQINKIQSDLEANDSNGSKTSTPGTQLRRTHPHSTPSSNIVGVLKELKDDIVDCNQSCNTGGRSRVVSKRGPTTGMEDVYIEQNGKFIKAPKELLDHCDFNTREAYLEEIGSSCLTPLDIAIGIEKSCSTLSRILLGMLAGVALLTFILILMLLPNWEFQPILEVWPFLAIICVVTQALFFIVLTICLVSMLDWLDLAHANPQHIVDTLNSRKIFMVLIIYFGAFIIILLTAPHNDYIIYNSLHLPMSNTTDELRLKTREDEVTNYVYYWKIMTIVYTMLCIFGWFVVTLTRNEDLFYLHLLGMKKYEVCSGSQLTYENQIACCQFS